MVLKWSEKELCQIAETDDLHISPFREDGVTFGTPTWIWSVVVGDAIYVRAYNGPQSRWFQVQSTTISMMLIEQSIMAAHISMP